MATLHPVRSPSSPTSLLLTIILILCIASQSPNLAQNVSDIAGFTSSPNDFAAIPDYSNAAPLYCLSGTTNSPVCWKYQANAQDPNFSALYRGSRAMIAIRYISNPNGPNETWTSAFFTTVDKYMQLSIPGSGSKLLGDINDDPRLNPRLRVDMIYRGTIFSTEVRTWATGINGNAYVPVRTVLITLNAGIPTSVAWATTNCVLSTCTCLDQICAKPCNTTTCGDINVMVGWTGTDVNGRTLTSSRLDIWRFKNAL
ncbi:hypothetical protein BJ742DRAFT_822210 [Cladochytrium replicatum]|nr:hypothetical protein BJ742DRAFT_822210 [Cladochytrium replicatum]